MSADPDTLAPSRKGILDRFFERRLEDPARLSAALSALVGAALWYGLCIFLLALGGVAPGTAPWIRIPDATYFWWESLFIGPVIVLTALLASAVAHLSARALGGTGSFEDTTSLLALATALGTLATLIPDTIIGALLVAGVMDPDAWMHGVTHPTPTLALVWVYLTAYLVAFGVLFPAAVRIAHDLHGWRPWVVGIGAFLLYQFVLFVFVR